MSADEVAGLLVLLGVVGVLAAIVGNGIAVGPVKFPKIPSSRQKLLAAASAVVIAGGVWWVIQQGSGNGAHVGLRLSGPAARERSVPDQLERHAQRLDGHHRMYRHGV